MMRRTIRIVLVILGASVTACESMPLCERSANDRGVEGRINKDKIDQVVTDELVLTGVMLGEVYIESVRVNGEPVTSKSGNFATWEVKLPGQKLEIVPPGDRARVVLEATDRCGDTYVDLDEFDVPVALEDVVVSELMLEAPLPAGRCYVPPGTSTPLAVNVSASVASAGAKVSLAVNPSTAMFTEPAPQLLMEGARAVATSHFTATNEGIHLLSATGRGDRSEPLSIRVIAGPTFAPTSLNVAAGRSASAFVTSGGDISNCLAFATDGSVSTASLNGEDLLAGPLGVEAGTGDCTTAEVQPIVVAFTADAPKGAKITVRCEDVYGESTNMIATAGDPSPPRRIDSLDLAIEIPNDRCYVPLAAIARANVLASSSTAAVGATVTFVSGGNEFPTLDNATGTLELDSGRSVLRSVFEPKSAGVASIVARSNGAQAGPVTIVVSDKPTIAPDTLSITRAQRAEAVVTSSGDLATCLATTTHPPNASASVVSSGADLLAGPVVVTQSAGACDVPETVRLQAQFDAAAPVGATITIDCVDTYGQKGSATFTANADASRVLTALSVAVAPPTVGCYVPTDQSGFGTVDVIANAEAVGTSVTLSAPAGSFLGSSGSSTMVTLRSVGGAAGATAFFSSSTASRSIPIVASADGRIAGPVAIRAAAAPSLTALSSTMLATDEVGVIEARTAGTFASCAAAASHPSGTTVTLLAGTNPDLTAGTAVVSVTPSDCTDVETLGIHVRFDATVPAGGSVRVQCDDVFGQSTPITFSKQ